jgi:uracil DNA glycosylase
VRESQPALCSCSTIEPKYTNLTNASPIDRNLTAWAENGVLMLNTCLTVKANQAGSHSNKGWETFTDKVVDVVDKYGGANFSSTAGNNKSGLGRGVVFLAWGAWAAKRVSKLNKVSTVVTGNKTWRCSFLLLFGVDETSHFKERCKLFYVP